MCVSIPLLSLVCTPTHRLAEYTKEPSPGTYPELSPPSPIKPRSQKVSANYSAVNNLAILPDEVRTPENLELGQLPEENAQQMLDKYIKSREQYEQAQLVSSKPESEQEIIPSTETETGVTSNTATSEVKENSPKPAPQVFSRPTPGYEDIDPIESAAQANTTVTPEVKKSSPKPSPQVFSPSTPGYEDIDPTEPAAKTSVAPTTENKRSPRVDDYNDPLDCLPPNHPLAGQITGRSSSQKKKTFQLSTSADDYTEVFDSLTSSGAPLPKVMPDSRPGKYKARASFSGSPTQCASITENGLKENLTNSVPGGSLDNVSGLRERGGTTRQSKRDSGKEIVELDFSKKRFRVTSKSSKQEDLIQDKTDGETSPKGGSPKKVDKEEPYAMVNLSDKQRYRAESDNIKKEGSGVPSHYGPEGRTVFAMST